MCQAAFARYIHDKFMEDRIVEVKLYFPSERRETSCELTVTSARMFIEAKGSNSWTIHSQDGIQVEAQKTLQW